MSYFKNSQQNNKNNKNSSKRPMQITKKSELDERFEDRLIDWATFYKRNLHRFIEHYFGIQLHFYQKIMIYLMNICPLVVLLCARAVSKSFVTSCYACAICVLKPNSKVLVTAMTKKQAGLLITEKVEKELMVMSPNLRREIKKISTGQNAIEVIFHNGSSFIAGVAGEQSRGLRSTILITDEFRLVDKEILDSVLSPTEIIRPTPYTMNPKYAHLQEEPREIFLSSAYWKNHWMFKLIKDSMIGSYKGESLLFATDYEVTLKHGIRTKRQMMREKQKLDSTTFDMEYYNLMQGGSENQYYSFELISNAQKIKKPFYPKTIDEYLDNKRSRFGDIKKQSGEIRVVSMDIAVSMSTKKVKNDLTVIKCIRALQNGEKYERQEVYTEAFEGKDIDGQAIRIRQIMEDFDADYFVFDGRTYGTNLVDSMAKILYDEERDKEYIPLKVFNNEALAERCKNPNASPIMWAFIGGSDTNHAMHTTMLGALKDGKYKMLISHMNCRDYYLLDKKEYKLATPEEKGRYELPFIYSDLTLNEMVNLSKEFIQGGKIKLSEPNGGTKDKYVSSAMGNLFIQELETKLTNKTAKSNFDPRRAIKYRQPQTHY